MVGSQDLDDLNDTFFQILTTIITIDVDDCITKIITMILKGGHLNRRAAATLVDGRVRLSTKVVLCQHFEKLNLLSHFMSG